MREENKQLTTFRLVFDGWNLTENSFLQWFFLSPSCLQLTKQMKVNTCNFFFHFMKIREKLLTHKLRVHTGLLFEIIDEWLSSFSNSYNIKKVRLIDWLSSAEGSLEIYKLIYILFELKIYFCNKLNHYFFL